MSRSLVFFAIAAMLASGAARGDVFGIVCEAGTFSPNGFQPCTPCPAGTFVPFAGAVACDAVPDGTWAPAGATDVQSCECADLPLCTLDPCDPATGVCLAHEPAPACLPYQVSGSGTVDSAFVQPGSAEVFTDGMPFIARFLVDPAEFDRFYSDSLSFYPNAIRDVYVRIGDGGESFEWVAEFGGLDILLGPSGGDRMTLVVEGEVPNLAVATFRLILMGDDLALGSDAIPPAFPAAIPGSGSIMSFSVGEGLFGATASNFVVTTPEPGTATATVASVAALLGLYRRRRRSAASAAAAPRLGTDPDARAG